MYKHFVIVLAILMFCRSVESFESKQNINFDIEFGDKLCLLNNLEDGNHFVVIQDLDMSTRDVKSSIEMIEDDGDSIQEFHGTLIDLVLESENMVIYSNSSQHNSYELEFSFSQQGWIELFNNDRKQLQTCGTPCVPVTDAYCMNPVCCSQSICRECVYTGGCIRRRLHDSDIDIDISSLETSLVYMSNIMCQNGDAYVTQTNGKHLAKIDAYTFVEQEDRQRFESIRLTKLSNVH